MEKLSATVQASVRIQAHPEKLYPLFTTAEGWDSWFTRGMVFRLEKDGECLFSWKDWGADRVTESERAVVKDFEINRYLKFEWNHFLPEGPTTVEISFLRDGEFTRIDVVQQGFPDTLAGLSLFGQCSQGWGEALALVRVYAEHGIHYN